MNLRDHQKKCIESIDNHFTIENRALVKMFCGSGKSWIIYNCCHRITSFKKPPSAFVQIRLMAGIYPVV